MEVSELQRAHNIPSMTWDQIACTRRLEEAIGKAPQINIPVQHNLHAGIYARTVRLPAGVIITGVLVKIPTVIIISGDCGIWVGRNFLRVRGYRVFSAAANRKQIFIAKYATDLTMCFPTHAKTVKEAEEQFTDEAHLLQNREV